MNTKPVVAHFHSLFFAKSETFIYNYISNFPNFKAICMAGKFENLNLFPFDDGKQFKISFPENKKERLLFLLFRKYRQIIEILKKEKVVLVHAHFGPSGVFILPYVKKVNLPLITTFYGYDISKLTRDKTWLGKYKILFKKGDLFLVEGPFMKSQLVKLGCPENKIMIQRIAIPIDKIPFRERLPKKQGENAIFIFSGRFVEKKGLIYALQAFKEVRKKFSNFKFRIIGDGPLKNMLLDYVKTNLMGDYVKFLGFLPYEEYLKEMGKADVFIHPSVIASDGDSEGGAPTTILEAQAMGMPVISTYHADIPNVTLLGQSAYLSQERDVKLLSKNIDLLLLNQKYWSLMGKAGRAHIESRHNIREEIKNLEDIYKSCNISLRSEI